MSSGSFVIAGYQTDTGDVRPIRVQPETIAGAWNPEVEGTIAGFFVRVSGSRRGFGVKARSVSLSQNVGAAVNGFQPKRSIRLPVLDPDAFALLSAGQTVEYLGSNWVVTGKTAEGGR